jgi:hypothetical protein
MYKYDEWMLTGICPYCSNAFENIVNAIPLAYMQRCSGCNRGLSVITNDNGTIIVERGLPVQTIGVIAKLNRGCCGD